MPNKSTRLNEIKAPIIKVFLGCAKEDVEIARAVRQALKEEVIIKYWDQFALASSILGQLQITISSCDFAIFVFNAHDTIETRDKTHRAVRDNVLIEIGMAMGFLGSDRTFLIVPDDEKFVYIPTDLLGFIFAKYDHTFAEEDVVSTLAGTCDPIRDKIKKLGMRNRQQTLGDMNEWMTETREGASWDELDGTWTGEATPLDHPYVDRHTTFPIKFCFSTKGSSFIKATSKFTSPKSGRKPVENIYHGTLFNHKYLHMSYGKRKHEQKGFGTLTLVCSDDAQSMAGKAMGYSSHLSKIFATEINIRKIDKK